MLPRANTKRTLFGLLGSATTPLSWLVEAEEGKEVVGYLLDQATLSAFAGLGYLVIVLPILGSGLAITIHTWRGFARAKHWSAGDYATFSIIQTRRRAVVWVDYLRTEGLAAA